IFGFWGHIHITEPNVSRSMVELAPINRNQDFYATLPETGRIPYMEEHLVLGREVLREKMTNGGIKHIQVFALKPGMIQFKDEIEGIILKGVGPDYDWTFLENYIQEGRPLSFSGTELIPDTAIGRD